MSVWVQFLPFTAYASTFNTTLRASLQKLRKCRDSNPGRFAWSTDATFVPCCFYVTYFRMTKLFQVFDLPGKKSWNNFLLLSIFWTTLKKCLWDQLANHMHSLVVILIHFSKRRRNSTRILWRGRDRKLISSISIRLLYISASKYRCHFSLSAKDISFLSYLQSKMHFFILPNLHLIDLSESLSFQKLDFPVENNIAFQTL